MIMRLRFKTLWDHRVQGVLRRRTRTNGALAPSEPADPALPVDADWDEAFLRVESYLRAHHVESRVLLTRLTTEILTDARALTAQYSGEAPVTVAMRVAQARIGEWLQQSLGEGDWADERFRARGRLALLLSELPREAPELLLSREALPAPLADRLTNAQLEPAPGMRPIAMPPAPLDFPLSGMVEESWVTFSRSAFMRSAASWLLFVGVLGFAWIATHSR